MAAQDEPASSKVKLVDTQMSTNKFVAKVDKAKRSEK